VVARWVSTAVSGLWWSAAGPVAQRSETWTKTKGIQACDGTHQRMVVSV
jgi:hypothetical protein